MSSRKARFLLLLMVLVLVATVALLRNKKRSQAGKNPAELIDRGLVLLQEQEQKAERDYWAGELQAQQYGAIIDQFWNVLNGSSNRLETAATLEIQKCLLPKYGVAGESVHGIKRFLPGPDRVEIDAQAWREWLRQKAADGWQLERAEFRHNTFDPGAPGQKPMSVFYFSAHLKNDPSEMRAILEGDIRVQWGADHAIEILDVSGLECRTRKGPPAFTRVLYDVIEPPPGSYFIDPLIAEDLDGDGVDELILAAKNRVYKRSPGGEWLAGNLCEEDPRLIFTAAMDDFDGDQKLDFLCAKFDGLFLYSGLTNRNFPNFSRQVWQAEPRLRYAQVFASGDIDSDGDLDLFLGQYKPPYDKGQMPVPYYDANDGYPSFVLVNDGKGNFTDVTDSSGLQQARFRRVYSASFVDLDQDNDLDLFVVSDFAGADAWQNDGHGRFTRKTREWVGESHGFGMSHQFADFNKDGRLDIVMIGMNSPTSDRLEHLGLSRPYHVNDSGMRAKVTFGNRFWFGSDGGGFIQPKVQKSITRTGWSWGCSTADLDNNGFADLYITNGHETRQSVQEYEPEFWLHDIYVGASLENGLTQAYFKNKFARTRGSGMSYGGYEKNRLFLNLDGTNFVEVAHLFGLGLQEDSRNVVATDLNKDGKTDLVLTTFEVWPRTKQTLQIFENGLNIPSRSIKPKRAIQGTSYRSEGGE